MCVRYSAHGMKKLLDRLEIRNCDELDSFKDNYNAAPGQFLPVITCLEPDTIRLLKWGLIPPWYKTGITASNMFNVGADTIPKRPVLRAMLSSQRCLVITSGYYEWKNENGFKKPHRVTMRDEHFTLLAGLFEVSMDRRTGEKNETFTIVTTKAAKHLEELYPQMPLTLKDDYQKCWIDSATPQETINEILFHDISYDIHFFPVSEKVTDSRNNLPGLIVKLETNQATQSN